MSLVICPSNIVSYECLSTDIVDNKVSGANYVGARVYVKDNGKTYVVNPDTTLTEITSLGAVAVSNMPTLGQAVMANSLPVAIASNQSSVDMTYTGRDYLASVEITTANPQSAYHANDAVLAAGGGLTEIQNVGRANGGSGWIAAIRVSTNKKSITPRFRLHFFNASNPTISNDNANWQDKYADVSKRIGYYDLAALVTAADTTNTDMSRVVDFKAWIPFKCAANTTSLWVGIETLDAVTFDNGQKISIVLYIQPN